MDDEEETYFSRRSSTPSIGSLGDEEIIQAVEPEEEAEEGSDESVTFEPPELFHKPSLIPAHVLEAAKQALIFDEEEEEDRKKSKLDYDVEDEDQEIVGQVYVDIRPGDKEIVPRYFDPDKYTSRPQLSEKSTIDVDALSLVYSFGYDCHRLYNLCVPDPDHLLYICGNYIHIFDVYEGTFVFKRSAGGGGLGHIAKHPHESIIAVGERGPKPLIILYEWPSLTIVNILEGGAKQGYNYISFSPSGDWLVSQGGNPDNMLVIWNWQRSRIILRGKAYGQDVYRVDFNPILNQELTTSGMAHIKFWKMAQTFTGLKLTGMIGKFGKTEICDVSTFFTLPRGEVASASSWGTMLIWEGDRIMLEVVRKNGLPMHEQAITYFEYRQPDGELLTVGMEGKFKVWHYLSIEEAPPSEEKRLELQPRFVRRIRDEIGYAHPMHVVPRNPADKQSFFYYMQDITGTIWLTEMAVKKKLEQPTRLLRFHSGPIGDVAPSPCDYYLASLGEDGFLHIRNVNKKKIILIKDFGVRGSSLLWLPISVDKTGCVLIMGFGDGTVRVAILSIRAKELNADGLDEDYITVVQAFKPHYEEVTCICLDPHRDIVVTASLDGNIFLHSLQGLKEYLILEPIGLVRMPGPIYFLTWNPNKEAILATCTNATAAECTIPEVIPFPGDETYELYLPVKVVYFKSVKSEILRDEVIQRVEKKRAEKIAERKAKMEKLQTTTPMMFMEDAIFLHDGEDEEEIPEIYIPEIPSTLYFGRYLSEDEVWFSAGGYDSGYVYEYLLGTNKPTRSTPLDLPEGAEMTCYADLFDGEYLILGTNVGSIKLVKTNPLDHTDLTDYWEFNMHDVKVKKVVLTYDSRMLYSIADDSNIFLYNINLDSSKFKERKNLPQLRPAPYEHKIYGIIGQDEKSLEQHKAIAQQMKLKKMGEEKKVLLKERLRILVNRFDYIFSLNRDLPDSQRMPDSFFEVDPTISRILEEKERDVKVLGLKKYEYEFWKSKIGRDKVYNFFIKPVKTFKFCLNGIDIRARVSTFYQAKLSLAYLECEREAATHVEEVVKKGRSGRLKVRELENEEEVKKTRHSTGPGQLIRGLDNILPRLGRNERALFEKLEQRRNKRLLLRRQLDEFRDSRPIMKNLFLSLNLDKAGKPNEAAFLLKIHPDYRTPRQARLTKAQKFTQVLDTRRRIYKLVDDFNNMVLVARKKKMDLIKYYNECEKAEELIRKEFGDIPLLKFPEKPIITDEEFPEKIYKDDERTYVHEMPVAEPTADPEFYLAYKMDQKFPIDNKIRMSSTMIWSDGLEFKYLTDQASKEYTVWERELIFRRMCKAKGSVLKMKRIINDMITEYDTEVARLQSMKIDYEKRITLLKIHLLKQCEELQIIRGIQTLEDVIHKRISVFIIQKHIYILRMNIRKNKIKKCEDNIISSTNNIKLLASEFADNIAESRWARHLAKLYRKKYRPPRKPDEESESESSSSDDDDDDDYDEDEESEMEMGAYQFDETIMPDGCDPHVFENTFTLRNRRHMEEIRISECRLRILSLQKDIDGLRRILLTIETILSIFQAKLDTLLKEKQTEMNSLKTLVVLDSYQMQHFNPEQMTYQPLRNTLLYPVEGLRNLRVQLAKLNEQESLFKDAKQECKNHVKRIQMDIIFLKDKLIELEKNIREAKVLKFGAHLNLEKMEETLMRRIVKEYRYSSVSIHRHYYREMLRLKSDILENQELLSDEYKYNTREQLKLSALEEQKNEYLKLITKIKHELKKEKEITEEELEQDIKHLNKIKRVQNMMKTALKNEIEQYKLKDTYLAQIGRKSQYFTEKHALSRSSVDDNIRVTTPMRKTPEEESRGEATTKDIGKRSEEKPKVKESKRKTSEREGGGTEDEGEIEISEEGMSEEGAQVGGSEATETTGIVEEMRDEGLSEEGRTEEMAEEEARMTSEEGQAEGDTEEEKSEVTESEEKTGTEEEKAEATEDEPEGEKMDEEWKTDEAATEGEKLELKEDEGKTDESVTGEETEVTEDEAATEGENLEVSGDEGKTDEAGTEEETEVTGDEAATEGDKLEVTEDEGKTDEEATEREETEVTGDEAATEGEKLETTEDEGKTDEVATEGEEMEVTGDEAATEGGKLEVTEDGGKTDEAATEGEETEVTGDEGEETEVTGDEAATEGEKLEVTEDEGKTDEVATEGEETKVTDEVATDGETLEVTEDEGKADEEATEEETEVTGNEVATEGEKLELTEDEGKTDEIATERKETEVTDEGKNDKVATEEETEVTADEVKTGEAETEGENMEQGKTDEDEILEETEEGVEKPKGIEKVEVEITEEEDKDEETADVKKEEQDEPVEETPEAGGDVAETAEVEETEDKTGKESVEAEGEGVKESA